MILASAVTLCIVSPLLLLVGCLCNGNGNVVAWVVSVQPVTEIASTEETWKDASADDKLYVGNTLRTGPSPAKAKVNIKGQGTIELGAKTRISFIPGQRTKELRLKLEEGNIVATVSSAADAPLLVLDSGAAGLLRLKHGATASIGFINADALQLSLTSGGAEWEKAGGEIESILEGAMLELSLGGPEDADAGAEQDTGPEADATLDSALDSDIEMGGVRVRALQGASIEIKPPGEEAFTKVRGNRSTVEPGTVIRVAGGNAELSGAEGVSVVMHAGSEGVVGGAGGGRLLFQMNRGQSEGRGGSSGVAMMSVPGGRVQTVQLGNYASFLATVVDRSSTRVNVTAGAAIITSGDRNEQVETGAEVTLRTGGRPTILAAREVQPNLGGGSAIIHDPQKMGGFTFRFKTIEKCKLYSVQVLRGATRVLDAISSKTTVAVEDLPYGQYRWKAACAETTEGELPRDSYEGRVSRIGDRSGSIKLPTKAPHNSLDSTGGSFQVLFQNRLPTITIRWSKAPEAPNYNLEIYNDNTGQRVHTGTYSRPAHSFKSGFFREGNYYWYFRATGGKTKAASPMTRFKIAFDNQMPAVHIIEPREGAAASGSVRVRGLAAVGSSVSVNGVPLDLGSDYRFDQQVPVGPGGLMIFRVTGRGTGLYLRHLSR